MLSKQKELKKYCSKTIFLYFKNENELHNLDYFYDFFFSDSDVHCQWK